MNDVPMMVDRPSVLALWAAIVSARLGQPKPDKVWSDLEAAFGERLDDVRDAMEALADRFSPEELNRRSYQLYTQFKPPSRKNAILDIRRISAAS